MNGIDWTALIIEPGLQRRFAFDRANALVGLLEADADRPPHDALTAGVTGPERRLPAAPLPDRPVTEVPMLVQPHPPLRATPAEVLRIAGLLRAEPNFDGVLWLCGASSLWAHLSAGEVVSMTRTASARLLISLGLSLDADDTPAFHAALDACRSRPERLLNYLDTADSDTAAGAILGAELAAARPWWLGQKVLALDCATAPGWSEVCARALAAQGADVTRGDAEAALIAGLQRARSGS